jgi:alanine racemase
MRAGADAFAVANVREAAEIREIGEGWPILVLSSVLPHEDALLAEYAATPAVSSRQELERFAALGRQVGRPCRSPDDRHRLGRRASGTRGAGALYEAIRATPGRALEGIFTHFSSADSDPTYTACSAASSCRAGSLPTSTPQRLLSLRQQRGP